MEYVYAGCIVHIYMVPGIHVCTLYVHRPVLPYRSSSFLVKTFLTDDGGL